MLCFCFQLDGTPGTYNASNSSSLESRNKEKYTEGSHSLYEQSTSHQSDPTNLNGNSSSNNNQVNSSRTFSTKNSKSSSVDSESDDCTIVNTPVELIVVSDGEESIEINFKNKNTMTLESEKRKKKMIPSSTQVLFTCVKPQCKLIFQNLNDFTSHLHEHVELGYKFLCKKCYLPFCNLNSLKTHQVNGECSTPGMFNCFECSEKFDDLQTLSIHKLIFHDGNLIAIKNNENTITCLFCPVEIPIYKFKSHLVSYHFDDVRTIKPKPKSSYASKYKQSYKCKSCFKVCLTAGALGNHKKIHNPYLPKRRVNKQMSNASLRN